MPVKKKSSARRPPSSRARFSRTGKFEALLRQAPPQAHFDLQLFVTGNSPRSTQAIANIRSLCDEHLKGRYHLEVIDIYQQPRRAVSDQIIAAPTLVKSLPLPVKRLIGDLSDRARVLVALNIVPAHADAPAAAANPHWIKL